MVSPITYQREIVLWQCGHCFQQNSSRCFNVKLCRVELVQFQYSEVGLDVVRLILALYENNVVQTLDGNPRRKRLTGELSTAEGSITQYMHTFSAPKEQ